jgi:hypothetical protein
MTTHDALVHWLPADQRGKQRLPATLRYVGLSRFREDGQGWPDGAWSIEVLFDEPPPEQGDSDVSRARVRFLFDTAPQERLFPGVRFGLHEGIHKVAEIEVIS